MSSSTIAFQATDFQQADLVNIPDTFFRRFKTGIESIDTLLGGSGFLPGSTFSITGLPGAGKTTLLLQILNALQKNGKMAGYATSEESIWQLAYTCKRLLVEGVQIANISDVDDIAKQMKNFDIMIVDSLQFVTCKHIDKPLKTQQYAIKALVEAAQKNECVLGIVQHLTSSGKAKGGTLVPHTVDANIEILSNNPDPTAKTISVYKNRFGNIGELVLKMSEHGFDFEPIDESAEEETPKHLNALKGASKEQKEVLDFITSNQQADVQILTETLNIASWRIPHYLRHLVKNGSLSKVGRGETSYWTLSEKEA